MALYTHTHTHTSSLGTKRVVEEATLKVIGKKDVKNPFFKCVQKEEVNNAQGKKEKVECESLGAVHTHTHTHTHTHK